MKQADYKTKFNPVNYFDEGQNKIGCLHTSADLSPNGWLKPIDRNFIALAKNNINELRFQPIKIEKKCSSGNFWVILRCFTFVTNQVPEKYRYEIFHFHFFGISVVKPKSIPGYDLAFWDAKTYSRIAYG